MAITVRAQPQPADPFNPATSILNLRYASMRAPTPTTPSVGTAVPSVPASPSASPGRPTSRRPPSLAPAPAPLARLIGNVGTDNVATDTPATGTTIGAPDAERASQDAITNASAAAAMQRKRASAGSIFAVQLPPDSVPAPAVVAAPRMLIGR